LPNILPTPSLICTIKVVNNIFKTALMTVGRIIATLIGCLILGVIAGLVTRNIIVAITFPFLLVAFLLMWRNLKQNPPKDLGEEEKEKTQESNPPQQKTEQPTQARQPRMENVQGEQQPQQPQQRTSPPPVSTNYPPTPPEL
jgi:choline-glycine betaine transporter